MAIDTSHKRFSIMLNPGEMGWPPSSGIDAADRAVMLEWYSGIAAAAPDVTGPPLYLRGSTQASIYLDGSTQATLYGRGSTQATFTIRGAV